MAEPLKNHFDHRIPRTLARRIAAVWPEFREGDFVEGTLERYDELGLMARGRHIARMLRRLLPDDYPTALEILLRRVVSLGSIDYAG